MAPTSEKTDTNTAITIKTAVPGKDFHSLLPARLIHIDHQIICTRIAPYRGTVQDMPVLSDVVFLRNFLVQNRI